MQDQDPYSKLRPAPPTSPDELCRCTVATPTVLRSVLGFNPIACAVCNLEVRPETVPVPVELVEQLASWASFHDCFYRLWLDSGEFELWARDQLSNPQSPVNTRGLVLRGVLEVTRRTYYWWFQDTGEDFFQPLTVCPRCSSPLADRGLVGLVCDQCSILVAN